MHVYTKWYELKKVNFQLDTLQMVEAGWCLPLAVRGNSMPFAISWWVITLKVELAPFSLYVANGGEFPTIANIKAFQHSELRGACSICLYTQPQKESCPTSKAK